MCVCRADTGSESSTHTLNSKKPFEVILNLQQPGVDVTRPVLMFQSARASKQESVYVSELSAALTRSVEVGDRQRSRRPTARAKRDQ